MNDKNRSKMESDRFFISDADKSSTAKKVPVALTISQGHRTFDDR